MVERAAPQAKLAALIMVGLLAWMWLLELVDQLSGNRLDNFGIHAQELDGLPGILTAPFLHAGWDHLISNSVPFLVLGFLVLLGGLARWALSSLISIVASGLTAWLLTPANTIVLGASGLIFGWLTYLLARGHLVPPAGPGGHRRARAAGLRRADLRRAPRDTPASAGRPTSAERSAAFSPPGCCTGAASPSVAGQTRLVVVGLVDRLGGQFLLQLARAAAGPRLSRAWSSKAPSAKNRSSSAGQLGRPGEPNVPAEPTSWWASSVAACR